MRRASPLFAAIGLLVALALVGCGPTGAQSDRVVPSSQPVYPEATTDPTVPVIQDLPYGSADGEPLLLDACFPKDAAIGDPGAAPRPAVVLIHGGSWARGDKAAISWRSACQWLATNGFVTVSVNYRFAPTFTFPAQLDDVSTAVRWLRDPAQVERYNIDPDRIAAFGGSAGGNLAALLGTTGAGGWTAGARVAAVVDLSGPVDLRNAIAVTGGADPDFGKVQLDYLGCTSFSDCPAADKASPVDLVDPTDPPFFVAHSIDEFIPLAQATSFVKDLRAAGVATTFVTVEGQLHSIAMLDDAMRARILQFLIRTIGTSPAQTPAPQGQ